MLKIMGQHAVVIGGSIAGLMSARVLADYFDRVTVFERDLIEDRPMIHKSIPQGKHIHVLLHSGELVMSSLYPGFTVELERLGAVRFKSGVDAVWYGPDGKGYNPTLSVRQPRDLGMDGHIMSRGLLEHVLRQRTRALANVDIENGVAIEGLIHESGQVRGVRCDRAAGSRSVMADLVVDAGGRASHAQRWLTEIGLPTAAETVIGVDFAYTSTRYRKPERGDSVEPIVFVGGPPPDHIRAAGLLEIENGVWHISLAGRFGDYPPTDEAGFLAFAQSLPSTRLYDLIKDAERIADISHHRFPTSIWRHYEWLPAVPAGLLLLGDAVSSFNPIYGQGMASAALQAEALQKILGERSAASRGLDGLPAEFFLKAAEVISAPWTLAAGFDFAYPKTRGERPPGLEDGARYFAALDSLQAVDIEVQRLLSQVVQLEKPLSALSDEPLRSRVFEQMQKQVSATAARSE